MNNQTEIIKPGAVSNDAGTATSVASPAVADKSKSVILELSEEEADMIQTLLNDYVLAYRSDTSVDYKPEPVPREKVGQYPYVATPPTPEIINPAYDWINKKWYSKNGSNNLPEIAQSVANLIKKSTEQNQVAIANIQQMHLITKQLGNQMTMMKQMHQTLAKGSQAQPTAPTVNTDTNGGKN
ncbi:MAG: hypothetical protein DQL95_04985 [Lactobacillus helveticus]|nr:MAG: hypothetical protein DQL95_04985 [Lactobacillus helveticus]AZA21602.1 MAG: hypothetical protein DQL94_05045 [Lactobacillus helveticus]